MSLLFQIASLHHFGFVGPVSKIIYLSSKAMKPPCFVHLGVGYLFKYGYGSAPPWVLDGCSGTCMERLCLNRSSPALWKRSNPVSLAVGALSAPAARVGKVGEQRGQSHSHSLF